MWDLGKKMVDNMGSNIVVNVIEPSIITIYRRKSSSQITPFLFFYTYIHIVSNMQFQKIYIFFFLLGSRVPIQQNNKPPNFYIFYYLASVPWKFTFVSMVMQVSNSVQPHHEYLKKQNGTPVIAFYLNRNEEVEITNQIRNAVVLKNLDGAN